MEEIYIIIFLMLILIIYLLYKVHDQPIGGCKGTIFGCCPNNITAKRNSLGTNC